MPRVWRARRGKEAAVIAIQGGQQHRGGCGVAGLGLVGVVRREDPLVELGCRLFPHGSAAEDADRFLAGRRKVEWLAHSTVQTKAGPLAQFSGVV